MKHIKISQLFFLIIFSALSGFLIQKYLRDERTSNILTLNPENSSSRKILCRWEMNSPDELENYSNKIRDLYFKDGKAYILYDNSMHISPEQDGYPVDIEKFADFRLSLYSRQDVLLIIRLIFTSEKGKSVNYVSENILVHKGWNRIKLDFKKIEFFKEVQQSDKRVNLSGAGFLADQVRLDFVNIYDRINYIVIDYLRLLEHSRIGLNSRNFEVWGDRRNIILDLKNACLLPDDKNLPAEINISPVGFDSSVVRINVSVIPKAHRPGLALFYRLYDWSKDLTVMEPSVRNWVQCDFAGGSASFSFEGSTMAELRIYCPPDLKRDWDGIETVSITFDRDESDEQAYLLDGITGSDYAWGARLEAEEAFFPTRNYLFLGVEPGPFSYMQINESLARGQGVIGIFKKGWNEEYIKKVIDIFGDFISLWALPSDGRTAKELNNTFNIINEIRPQAQVVLEDDISAFLRQAEANSLKSRLQNLKPSYLELDRGPLFFTGIIFLSLVFLIVLREKIGVDFSFRLRHLKWFGICLILSTALLLPMVFIFGLGNYRYIYAGDIITALYRYGISAFLQELIRALAIEYTVILVLSSVKNNTKRYLSALLITSVFFSLGHLGYPGLDLQKELSFLIITFFAGLIFGYSYIKSRSITPPFVLHLIADIFLFVFTTM